MHYFLKVKVTILLLLLSSVQAQQVVFQENNIANSEKNKLVLTAQEQVWIKENKVVSVIGDSDWFPFEGFNKEKQYVGIVAEVLNLISEKSGLTFNVTETLSWHHTIQYSKDKQVDIISASASNPMLEKNYRPTFSTIKNPIVMIASKSMHYIPDLETTEGMNVAILSDSGYSDRLKQAYPNIKFIEVNQIDDGLIGVVEEQFDIVLMSMAVASYQMAELGLYELRVVGVTDLDMELTLFVNRDKPILWEIINKVKLHETQQERHEILSKWIKHKYIDRYSPENVRLFGLIVIFMVIFFIYRNRILKKQAMALTALSQTDKLTDTHNRLSLDKIILQKVMQSQRYKSTFSLIMIDIDLFKQVNDKHGHLVGDKLLQQFALLLQENIRESDLLGRWGGEEFLIVCPNTSLQEAVVLAQKLRYEVDNTIFLSVGKKTASFGVAEYKHAETAEDCLVRADSAMYRAKSSGRNKVIAEE